MNTRLILTAGIASLLLTAATLRAQTWDAGGAGGGSLLWSTGTNWSGDVAPVNDGTANVSFGGLLDLAPDMDANWWIASLTFNNGAGPFTLGSTGDFTLTIGAGGITHNDDSTQTISNAITLGAAQTWNVASTGGLTVSGTVNNGGNLLTVQTTSATANLSGVIGGGGGLTKTGTNTLTLSGTLANIYTGTTTVNAGTLILAKTAGIDALTGSIVIGDGSGTDTLQLGASNQTDFASITVNSSGVFNLNNFSEGMLALTINGGSVTTGTGTLTAASLAMTAGSISSTSAGSLLLNGNLTVISSGTVAAISGNLNLGGSSRTFTVGDGSELNDLNITAVVSNGGIQKAGTGALRLAGNNTFAGDLDVNSGTLIVAHDNAVGTAPLGLLTGTTIQAEGTRVLANAVRLYGDFTVGGADLLTFNGGTTLNANVAITTTNTQATTFSGAIGENAAGRMLTKAGAGTLAFTGASANTYTGTTTVNEGTLQLGKTFGMNAIAGPLVIGDGVGTDTVILNASDQIATTTVTVASSGVFDVNGQSEFINTLNVVGGSVSIGTGSLHVGNTLMTGGSISSTGAGSFRLNSDLATGGSAAASTISGNLDLNTLPHIFTVPEGAAANDLDITAVVSNGFIQKAGSGLLRLAGNNTFAGFLNVIGGTLVVAHDNAAGTGTLGLFSGTIQAEGTRTLTNAVTLGGNFAVGGGDLLTFSGAATLDGDRTITTSNTQTTTFSGAIGQSGGPRGLTKAGTGDLSFTGASASANTYTGATTVNAGTLVLAKNAGVTAVAGDLVIGDGSGGEVVALSASNQIADTSNVTINSLATLNLALQSDAIGSLTMTGGTVNGTGTLTVGGNVTTNASGASALINPNLDLGAATRTFSVAEGGAANDLDISNIVSNGGITKSGAGLMRLGGASANTFTGTTTVDGGTLVLAKTAANGAIAGALVIGDSSGTDIVRLDADDQIANASALTFNSAGLLDLNGFSDTVGTLTMTGGAITTGVGTLTLGGDVTTNAHTAAATIAGALNLGGAVRTFTVANGAAAIDLDITATTTNGGIDKQGAGTMNINGTFGSAVTLGAGTLGGAITIASTGSYTQTAGTFSGALTNQGTFTFNGGTFTGSLANQATATFNASFTAGGGIENAATLTVNSGVTLTANGTGFVNLGTTTLTNGTLAGTSATNDFGGQLNARGTITTPFTNNGTLDVTGLLTLSAASSNAGGITVATSESLRPNAAFSNTGIITLSGGAVTGTGTVTNAAGGVIRGNGAVSAAMAANAGLVHATGLLTVSSLASNSASGELRVDAAQQLNVTTAFANAGFISLRGADATLAGGAITNTGLIDGVGRITNAITNGGVIHADPGTLTLAGATTVSSAGRIEVGAGAELLATGGVSSNAGVVALDGGRFESSSVALNNTGTITGFGTLATGGLTNNGGVTLTGGNSTVHGGVTNAATKQFRVIGNTALFTGNFTNNGTFKNTSATVTFAGSYTENGTFISDPADNYFTNLYIGSSGALVGGLGDRFIVGDSLLGASTQNSTWQTSAAELRFAGGASHTFTVFADDEGASYFGYDDNFAWGTLALGNSESLLLDESLMPGGVVYAAVLALAGGLAQIASITGAGTIYYDPYLAANWYLAGAAYSLSGGGTITPIAADLRILSCHRNASGHMILTCVGAPERANRVEATTNLTNPASWTTIGTVTAAPDGTFPFTDTNASSFSRRFYRLVYP